MQQRQRIAVGRQTPNWTNGAIWAGSALFVVALFVSAVFDPTIRLLHALQSLIYVGVVLLSRSNSPWGYGAGCIVSTFWNSVNPFFTGFIASGLNELVVLLQTGQLARPDLMISVVAFAGHCLLICACLVAFLRASRNRWAWLQFVGGGLVAIGYFALIIITTAPQYIPLLKIVFHV